MLIFFISSAWWYVIYFDTCTYSNTRATLMMYKCTYMTFIWKYNREGEITLKKCFNFCWYTCRHQQFNCAEMNKWHYNRYVLYERTRLFAVAVKKSCTHSKFGLLSNKPTHVQYTCFPPATTSHSQCGWVSWGYWLRKWQQTKLYLGEILSLEKNWVCQWTSRAKFTKQRAVGRHCYLKVNTYPFSISYQSSNCRNKKFYVSTCSLQKNWASECYNNDTVFQLEILEQWVQSWPNLWQTYIATTNTFMPSIAAYLVITDDHPAPGGFSWGLL